MTFCEWLGNLFYFPFGLSTVLLYMSKASVPSLNVGMVNTRLNFQFGVAMCMCGISDPMARLMHIDESLVKDYH